MFRNYLKTAWRTIRKNRVTSFINIGGLAVGMTAAVLILLWVQSETSFDSNKGRENIYRLTTRIPSTGWVWETTPLLLADAIKTEIPQIEKVSRLNTMAQPVFNINGTSFYAKHCAYVDNDWFDIFQYDFKEGSAEGFNENPFSLIITASEAKKYFGDKPAVGQVIHVDTADYKVRAVVADAPVNSSFQYTVFMPISAMLTNPQTRENDQDWGNDNYVTFIKTAAGSDPDKLARAISAVRKNRSGGDGSVFNSLIALKDMHFESDTQGSIFPHGNRNTVYIFSFLGFLLLLVACINYVNLATARASLRAKEVSIRKISGAGALHLFLQFMIESVLICLVAMAATVFLVQLCLPVFNELTQQNFILPVTSPGLWQVLGITLLVALLLNSVYPALLLSSFKPLNVFRGRHVLRIKEGAFRKGLVVLQFVISVILIAGTIVLYSQLHFVQKNNPGYNRAQTLSFALPFNMERDKREGLVKTIKQDLLSQSGIQGVGVSNQPVINIGSMCSSCADWQGRDTSLNPKISQLSADADFFKTMQLQMKEGNWFEEGNTGQKKFILNETAVKELNFPQPAIGQRLIFKGDTGQVIGVVKDFHYKSLHEKIGPLIAFNNPSWQNFLVVRIAASNSAPVISAIEKTWKKYIPANPLEYTFLDETFNRLYRSDQQTSFLMMVFAVIAIVISALGLFSLAAFAAEQRTREIGIRKVLGCTVAGITSLLSRDFIKLVGIAILIASPIAWWLLNEWLQGFAYRISISWWMFALAGLLAVGIALFTVSFQAIKAALANPVKSLRSE